jgi:hypothetical protein
MYLACKKWVIGSTLVSNFGQWKKSEEPISSREQYGAKMWFDIPNRRQTKKAKLISLNRIGFKTASSSSAVFLNRCSDCETKLFLVLTFATQGGNSQNFLRKFCNIFLNFKVLLQSSYS